LNPAKRSSQFAARLRHRSLPHEVGHLRQIRPQRQQVRALVLDPECSVVVLDPHRHSGVRRGVHEGLAVREVPVDGGRGDPAATSHLRDRDGPASGSVLISKTVSVIRRLVSSTWSARNATIGIQS
jgi:hypothetical protein